MVKKLREGRAQDIIPRLERLQQNYATLSAEIPQMIRDEVEKSVRLTVNGKIDAMHKELNDRMDELQPYMQFASGLGIVWKVVLALGSLALLKYVH